ncbi:MAG: CocE/NonD family hydrolase [Victivallales bacterium]|nr:CocE/NonD family hydrolase [Victivallales bacterium]
MAQENQAISFISKACIQAQSEGQSLDVELEEFFVPMRDGVRLYTKLARPAGVEKCPLIVVRTPYEQPGTDPKGFCENNLPFLLSGYGIFIQHCRGCGNSEGDCIPYINEHDDGLDCLTAMRNHPAYNGEFYLFGGSYLTSVHLSYLKDKPDDVKGAFLAVQEDNRYNVLYRNGMFKCGLHGSWYLHGMYKKKSLVKNYSDDVWRMLPASGICQAVLGEEAPLSEELRHPSPDDPFWKTREGGSDYYGALENLDIPVAIITAWHDIYPEGIINMWHRLPPAQRARCPLLITGGNHGWYNVPDLPLPLENAKIPSSVLLAHSWFEYIRKGTPMDFFPARGVKWYNLFGQCWETGDDLPSGKTPWTLYLNDGRTLAPAPTAPAEITYTYIPAAPAPFPGACGNTFGGMEKQPPPNSRYDIISFLSEPVSQPVQIRGQSEIKLQVRSDCPDTCFYARLSIVHDDVAYCLRDDICTLAQFSPDYQPGQVVTLQMHFGEIEFLVNKGDSLRLDISSSAWRHYIPHTNRRGLFADQTGADTAHNTILTGVSSLTLHMD